METTKGKYMALHPKSYLAARLNCVNWPDDTKINIIGGLDTPYDKRSNLYHAIQGTSGKYVRGGHRQRGTEGWWFAVKI